MKTHTIKTPKAELLVVELPEGSEPLSLIGNSFFYYEKDMVKEDYPKSLTLAKSYTVLGKPDEISEEDAKELAERIGEGDPCYQGDWFVNYQDDEYMFETAKESLLSLLESEIYWENPIKVHTWASENADMYLKQWQEAEQKTFDRNRTLIFKKN